VRIWTAVRCAHWSPVSDEAAVRLAQGGLLRAEDVDPAERPGAALALLGEGAGLPRWARALRSGPVPGPPRETGRLLAMIDRHGHRVAAMVATNPDASPAVLERPAQGPSPARKALR
jgi:hypothetical protein